MNAPAIVIAERGARPTAAGVRPVVTAIVILWFAGVVAAHYAGLLRVGPGNLPVPFGVAIAVPIAIFFASYWAVPRFRAAVLDVDLRLVTSVQAWRVAGFVFLPLLVFGHLPALFAWPAGLGDVAVGLAAPWVVWRVVKDASYATTRGFATFHCEPYRVCRRAFSLRGWSHVTTESVFPRSTRASGAAGPRARG